MPSGHAVIFEESLRVPAEAFHYDAFQTWLASPEFPPSGRIDFVAGDVEVDMSPEDLHRHGIVKTAIAARLHLLVTEADSGEVFVDRARLRSPSAELSVEPDVVVVLWDSLRDGRVRYVVEGARGVGRFSVIEGAADVVVEVVSDSSVAKDTRRLPRLYARAGVPELWIVDARRGEPRFEIHTLRNGEYALVVADADGWLLSPRLGWAFRLIRRPTSVGHWRYDLEQRSARGRPSRRRRPAPHPAR